MIIPARKLGSFVLVFGFAGSLSGCNSSSPTPTPTGTTPTECTVSPSVAHAISLSSNAHIAAHHVPRAIRAFSDIGKMSEEQNLGITLSLSLNNESELDAELASMYTPSSPTYHQFMSPAEFKSRYAPTEEQVNAVQEYLEANGVHSTGINSNGFMLYAKGSVSSLNSLFQTEVHQYLNTQGSLVYSPSTEPRIPSGLGVNSVHGLQNVTHWKSFHQMAAASPLRAGSGPGGGLSPSDIKTAYSLPTSATGAGETMAVFELDGYNPLDIAHYESAFGVSAVPLQNVQVDSVSSAAGAGADEVTLDIELMIAIAPGASKLMVYEGPNSDQGILDTYAKIANDDLAREVSTSWGAPEAQSTSAFILSENTIFKQMAAQGQSLYAASGDSGALDNGTTLSVDDPASQPYVVGVGGTRLYTTAGGAYDHETTWNEDGKAAGGAGGGGISTIWPRPTFQSGVVPPVSFGSGTMRNIPDVSLDADPTTGYSIYVGGQWQIFGGTSCAAPIWTAYTALVNQQRIASGYSALGYPNPTLYQIRQSTRYSNDFSDIADGSTNLYYPAVTGYDDATGLGSFKGTNLFNDLTQSPLNLTFVSAGGC